MCTLLTASSTSDIWFLNSTQSEDRDLSLALPQLNSGTKIAPEKVVKVTQPGSGENRVSHLPIPKLTSSSDGNFFLSTCLAP